jgi:hypothetical protein
MSKYFLTFGSHNNYLDAGFRLYKQANSLNLFDKLLFYEKTYLENDTYFWPKHGNFIKSNPRGYGFWLWKPYLIKKTMDAMKDGDILMYLDCGCEIDINKKDLIKEFFEIVKNDYIIGSLTSIEKEYVKMDLLIELDMLNHDSINHWQHEAGALLFLINDKTRTIVNKWYELSCNYHLIDDTPSVVPNFDCFIDHRHDQSIFSLLTKKYNIFSKKNICDIIEYDRNKSKKSKFDV